MAETTKAKTMHKIYQATTTAPVNIAVSLPTTLEIQKYVLSCVCVGDQILGQTIHQTQSPNEFVSLSDTFSTRPLRSYHRIVLFVLRINTSLAQWRRTTHRNQLPSRRLFYFPPRPERRPRIQRFVSPCTLKYVTPHRLRK